MATETKAGATTNYTFDAFDRLIADGDSLYSYDALDRVSSRIKGAAKQNFAYAGLSNDLAAVTDSGGAVQAKYGRDAGGTLLGQQEGTNPALATLTDLHGDLVATYSTTALATTTAYDPFGTVTAQTGVKTTLGYQGEYTDPDTGKVNMHARWYQPGTGNFASRDTATLEPNPSVQANRYTYTNASPMTGTDPTGHSTIVISGDAVGDTWNSPYTPGIDYQTAIEYYAQHGIVIGGGGSAKVDALGIGESCIACISADEVVLGGVTVMTEEEMKRQKILPNGMEVPKKFWQAKKKVRSLFLEAIYLGASKALLKAMWKAYLKGLEVEKVAGGAKGPIHGCGNKDCSPEQEYQACVRKWGASDCKESKWKKGQWKEYKFVVGVWEYSKRPTTNQEADLLELVDTWFTAFTHVDWEYEMVARKRDRTLIMRRVDTLTVCASPRGAMGACVNPKTISRERWAYRTSTEYDARIIASWRYFAFDKRHYRERNATREVVYGPWIQGKPDPDILAA